MAILLIGGLTLVAAFLRLYHLDAIPPGLHGDEAWTGIDGLRVLKEGWIGPYVLSALGQPAGPLYWTALVFKLFGASLFTLRLSMALLGILTVPAYYLLCQRLFNHRVAFIATLLLTFSYWHIHFSRTAFMLISLPLIQALSLLFLFRGMRGGKLRDYALGGAFLGLGFYTYNSFPFFLLALVLFLLYKALRERKGFGKYVPRLGLFFATSMVIALPFLTFVIDHRQDYLSHLQAVSIFKESEYQEKETPLEKLDFWMNRVAHIALIFNRHQNVDYSDGLGGKPLLDPLTGILFAGGVLICLWRWKQEEHMLILLGLSTGLLGAIFTVIEWGEYRRVISALPFAMLAAALPLDALWRFLNAKGGRRGKQIGLALAVLVLGFVAFHNTNYYFRDLANQPSSQWIFGYDLVQAINYLKTLNQETYVYFYSSRWSYDYETRRFLLPQMPGEDRSEEFGDFGIEKSTPGKVVYLLMPTYQDLGEEIKGRYPGGDYREFIDEDEKLLFAAYYLDGTHQ